MALSERKDDTLIVKDDTANPIVKNHEWPNALPVEMNRVVISYLLNPTSTLEEVEALNETMCNTMQPFVKAIDKIKPLLGNSIFKKIQDVKFTKYNLQPTLESKDMENIVFDEYIKKISHLPTETQIDFLVAVYNENWDREEKSHVLNLTMNEIKKIYKSGHLTVLPFLLKEHIFNIIITKLNVYICNAYQSSTVRLLENDRNGHVGYHVNRVEQLLQSEQGILNRKERGVMLLDNFPRLLGLITTIILLDGRYNKYPIGGIFAFLCLASLPFWLFFKCSGIRTRNNTDFLMTARNSLNQVQRENIINGQKADVVQESEPEDRKEQGPKLKHS